MSLKKEETLAQATERAINACIATSELKTLVIIKNHIDLQIKEIDNTQYITVKLQIKRKTLLELNAFILSIAQAKHLNLN